MPKRVLLSGYFGFENFGDDLILDVLIQQLKSWNVEPIVLSGTPEITTEQFGVQAVPRTSIPAIWEEIGRADALISGGGGLFQDITGIGSTVYYGGLIQLAHWRNTPIAFFGQGIGPLSRDWSKLLTARSLRQSDLIITRDVKSQAIANRLTRKKTGLMADSVWTWEPPFVSSEVSGKALAVSLRPWIHLDNDIIEHIASVILQYPDIETRGVHLIDCQAGSDIIPLDRLETLLKQRGVTCKWFTGMECARGIGTAGAFIGMRFHALLAAALMQVPAMALSYDPKVQFLASSLKLHDVPITAVASLLTPEVMKKKMNICDSTVIEAQKASAAEGFQQLKTWLGV